MTNVVDYSLKDRIATITFDDGKANVMTLTSITAISEALARAEQDGAVAILTGRTGVFSAGYDMAMFDLPIEQIMATMRAGGELVHQLLSHPLPLIGACNGHAIAQGAFTLLGCDVRLGVDGGFKIGLNEVAIGLTIPHYGVEIARHQLTPAWFDHATVTGELYEPSLARQAGFLHHLVDADSLEDTARESASRLASVDLNAHAGTKGRARRLALDAILAGVESEFPLSEEVFPSTDQPV
ncbi:MAG: crotonase/enoyl-CoA hydratase family protein [Acidimicrobiales bacterium]